MKFLAFIMLVAGATVGGPIAQLSRGGQLDLVVLWFFLGSHVFAAQTAYFAFIASWHDPRQSMTRIMVVLGYLAGIGCGVAFVVT